MATAVCRHVPITGNQGLNPELCTSWSSTPSTELHLELIAFCSPQDDQIMQPTQGHRVTYITTDSNAYITAAVVDKALGRDNVRWLCSLSHSPGGSSLPSPPLLGRLLRSQMLHSAWGGGGSTGRGRTHSGLRYSTAVIQPKGLREPYPGPEGEEPWMRGTHA